MPRMFRLMFLIPALLLNDAGTSTDGEPTTDHTPPPDDRDDDGADEQLGEAGKRALERERAARKAAERAARDAQAEMQRMRDEQRKREEAEAAEQGRFRELAERREAELAQAQDQLTAVQQERDALLDIVRADVESHWDQLPDEVREAYDGADDDVLSKRRHMHRMAKVIQRLTTADESRPGNGPNPRPADTTKRDLEAAANRARPRYNV